MVRFLLRLKGIKIDKNGIINIPIFSLKVGHSCNNKCIHCFIDHKKDGGDLTTQRIKSVIDSVREKSVIEFTGGEPTIRNDIIELVKYAKKKGHLTRMQTNGNRFSDKTFTKKISKYLDSVLIPIHSVNPTIHDIITDTSGSWKKTIDGIKNLKKTNIDISTQTVINRKNVGTLKETFDFIHCLVPKAFMSLTFPHPIGIAKSTEIVPSYIEVYESVQAILNKHRKLHTHYIPKCFLYPYQNEIVNVDNTDDGSEYKPGINYIDDWELIDYGEFDSNTRIKSIKCRECIFDNECIGVWREYGELYDFNKDVKPVKR